MLHLSENKMAVLHNMHKHYLEISVIDHAGITELNYFQTSLYLDRACECYSN